MHKMCNNGENWNLLYMGTACLSNNVSHHHSTPSKLSPANRKQSNLSSKVCFQWNFRGKCDRNSWHSCWLCRQRHSALSCSTVHKVFNIESLMDSTHATLWLWVNVIHDYLLLATLQSCWFKSAWFYLYNHFDMMYFQSAIYSSIPAIQCKPWRHIAPLLVTWCPSIKLEVTVHFTHPYSKRPILHTQRQSH